MPRRYRYRYAIRYRDPRGRFSKYQPDARIEIYDRRTRRSTRIPRGTFRSRGAIQHFTHQYIFECFSSAYKQFAKPIYVQHYFSYRSRRCLHNPRTAIKMHSFYYSQHKVISIRHIHTYLPRYLTERHRRNRLEYWKEQQKKQRKKRKKRKRKVTSHEESKS